MRRLTVIAAAAAALLATVLAAGAPAAAGVVTIHPDQFVAEPSATVTHQNPGSLGGNGSFFRVESLPGELDGPARIAPGNRWFVSLRLDSTNGAIHDVRVVWR